jgi:DNA repair protein RadC
MMEKPYTLHIRDLPEEEKPREKLRKYGPAALKNYELMAVILGRGSKKEGILELSQRIMSQYGNQAIFSEEDVGKVEKVLGLSPVQACQIVAAFELGRRLFGRQYEVFLRSPEEIFQYARDMARLKKEHLRGLYLDTRNKLLRDEIISIGTLNASLAYPRDVLSPALESHAAAVIIIHNHPSGDPSPSEDDVELTKRICQAGKILEIDFLDHVIIGDERYISLREKTDIWKET